MMSGVVTTTTTATPIAPAQVQEAPAQAHDSSPSLVSFPTTMTEDPSETAPSSPESTNTLVPTPTPDPSLLTPCAESASTTSSLKSTSTSYPFPDDEKLHPGARVRVTSIRFAPLPATEPSKKRGNIVPLGVNARSRRRRENQDDRAPSLFTPPQQQQQQRVSLWQIDFEDEEDEDEGEDGERGEDPIVVFGRMLKETSVGLWKRVSPRRKGERVQQQLQLEQEKDGGKDHGAVVDIRRAEDEDAAPEKEEGEKDFGVVTITERESMPVLPLLDVGSEKSLSESASAAESDEQSLQEEAAKDTDEQRQLEEDKARLELKRRQSCPDGGSRSSSPELGSKRRKSWSASSGDAPPIPIMPLPPLPPLPVLTFPDF
ncbi:hypothetical protein CONPUDRAFT_141645 [Coniophora puteana RWD-64-598 SS2]|uniref:Uncharacterized protein n=1 Tax=Coniophora puteana (strain RWD-64-598) TaxID=741705 RepID=A0A5M3N076_CONPW|nr:uncharacterized protein CONPUDRAFT_141645 [Coniophora puteana RWD-64-598 SS2]EIW84768.1 hypothetical protein CONPUDRAFT_141645 [Coniophora puteana RWD-64-598 SS2]